MKNLFTLLHVFALGAFSFSQTVSIHDIQFTSSPSGESPEMGNIVTTYGIVTGIFTIGDVGKFFIQDGEGAWNGIYINEDGYTVTPGDSVEITGTVTEYFGLTEISLVTNLTIISSGNTQPAPFAVTTEIASMEPFESVLISVVNATCVNANAGLGQFIVNDGSGDCIIDDEIYGYDAQSGGIYEISGIRYFFLGESKICPRSSSDVTLLAMAEIDDENETLFSIYPNPASDLIVIKTKPGSLIRIYAMNGALVYEGIETLLDISDFEQGVYQVSILQNEKISTQKLIVN